MSVTSQLPAHEAALAYVCDAFATHKWPRAMLHLFHDDGRTVLGIHPEVDAYMADQTRLTVQQHQAAFALFMIGATDQLDIASIIFPEQLAESTEAQQSFKEIFQILSTRSPRGMRFTKAGEFPFCPDPSLLTVVSEYLQNSEEAFCLLQANFSRDLMMAVTIHQDMERYNHLKRKNLGKDFRQNVQDWAGEKIEDYSTCLFIDRATFFDENSESYQDVKLISDTLEDIRKKLPGTYSFHSQ